MPDEFFEAVVHHLPPEQFVGPGSTSAVLWFVLITGARGEDFPAELGCSGRTGRTAGSGPGRRPGIWDRLHADQLRLADKLDTGLVVVDSSTFGR